MRNLFRIKSFFKFLDKNKFYTFIEVFGMSVSFMFIILIATYTYQEFSTDHFHEKGDRIYVLADQETFGFAYRLGDRIKDRYPEIEEVCPMINYYRKSPVKLSTGKINADLLMADSSFFHIFSFDIKEGDRINPMAARNSAVISRSFANKAFPDRNPLGEVIELEASVKVTVNGIMEDIKNSIIPYGDILVRIENIQTMAPWEASESLHSYGSVPLIFLVKEGADIHAKTGDLLGYLKENVKSYKEGVDTSVSFIPLKDVYFSDINGREGWLLVQGDWTFVMILVSVGVLILIFAIINYVNLTVAQTGFRAKEMATRRLLGSSRQELIARLMMESTVLSFVSFIVGIFLAFAAVPFVNNLLETKIDLAGMITPVIILLCLIVILGMGFISGLLPAIIISNAKPVDVVKGAFRQKTKMVFSKFFITFQNIITIALVTASITMIFQINYLINAPLGYNTTNIIDIPVESLESEEQTSLIKQELEQLASVKRIGVSSGMPFNYGNNYTLYKDGNQISFQSFVGDTTFINLMGFEILRDNHLAPGEGFYLSERAFKALGYSEDIPSFPFEPFFEGPQLVAGTIRDFQIRNILFEPRPLLLRVRKADDISVRNLAVEVTGSPHEVFAQVQKIYENITELEFPGKFIDQQIEQSFIQQKRTSQIVVIFAGIAVLLSLLGLLAMSTYFIQQRSREIAVRKVFGSENIQILKRLVITFMNYVVIAFVIVTPFIWYLLKQWLSGYSYRISLSPWFFITGGLFCMLIAFITVIWQSYQAATSNPVDSIKAE